MLQQSSEIELHYYTFAEVDISGVCFDREPMGPLGLLGVTLLLKYDAESSCRYRHLCRVTRRENSSVGLFSLTKQALFVLGNREIPQRQRDEFRIVARGNAAVHLFSLRKPTLRAEQNSESHGRIRGCTHMLSLCRSAVHGFSFPESLLAF